jgi:UPF0755 protein
MTAAKRIFIFACLVILLAGGASLWLRAQYFHFLETPLDLPAEGYVLQVQPGTSGRALIEELEQEGITRAGWEWKLLMKLEPMLIRAGEFALEQGARPRDLLQIVSSGMVIQYRLTLVEGWTFRQLLEALGKEKILENNLAEEDPQSLQQFLHRLEIENPEGWFLPETYQFSRGDSDIDILERSHEAMKTTLQEAWNARSGDLPLKSPYELLILASIIEKETSLDSERAQIAGVFIRRLNKGMRLQTDPTVIYGMGESYDGNIRRKDLQADTPYNTYTRSGLPPTPIAMPGRASLMAAGNPLEGDSLYFVADGKGGHTFSATLQEHQAAVRKLIGKG